VSGKAADRMVGLGMPPEEWQAIEAGAAGRSPL